MNRFKKTLGFITAVLLGGCAATIGPRWAGSGELPQVMDTVHEQRSPQAELMYHVLVAELAARRGQYATALEHYQAAFLASDDPRLAEHAVNLSLVAEDDAALLEVAQRWYRLEPHHIQARQAMAMALLRNGQIEEAILHLEAVRAAVIGDGQQGFAAIAALLGQIGDQELVFQAMQALRDRHPQSLFVLYYHALAALNIADYETALESLEVALAQDPQWEPAHLLRAQVLVEQGDTEAALEDLEKAVTAMPDNRALRTGYARLLVEEERLLEAQQQFQVLAGQNPQDVGSWFALGLLAAEQGEFDQAVDYFEEVLRRGQQVMDAYYELGRVEELRGDYQQARAWYSRVEEDERYLSAQVGIGRTLAKAEDFSAMAEHFTALRRDHPQNAITLYLAEADILREEGRHQASFDLLSQALQEQPDDHDLLYARALAAEKIDRLDILEKDLLTIIEADPDHGHALNALGYTLADRTERHQEALEYLQRAIVLLPDDPAVQDSMGWVYYRLGRYEESLEYLRRAHDQHPDPEIAAHLSEVLWVTGQRDEARAIWKAAMAEHPDDPHLLRVKERFGL